VALIRTGFKQSFEELSSGDPTLGQICLLPWDSETFGFSVATYKVGADNLDRASFDKFLSLFSTWVQQNEVELCSCGIPPKHRFWIDHFNEAGFLFVDMGIRASLRNLSRVSIPQARFELREAKPEDFDAIEAIASGSFHDGRYHADPIFPARLANMRYRDWMRRALKEKNSVDRVYVLGQPGSVDGFYHVTVEDTTADLRLAAVAPALKGTMVGFDLYVAVLIILKTLGVRRVDTNISAANTAVLNVYAALGFRFSDAEAIYHWHSERMRSGAIS
jgi:hypothetical protein